MPESRKRKRPIGFGRSDDDAFAGPPKAGLMKRIAAPGMLTCWLLGLVWVVVYYALQADMPLVGELGGWNLIIGMGLIGLGFVFATNWE